MTTPIETHVTNVSCNKCGATLHVSEQTRFATCSYCGTQLEVHRTDSAVYTEVLRALDERTQQLVRDVSTIKQQNDIERLDREWHTSREALMDRDKEGRLSVPSAAVGLIGAAVAVVFGALWMVVAGTGGAPAIAVLCGLVFVVLGIVGGLTSVGKAANYRDAEREYLRKRESLLGSNNPQA